MNGNFPTASESLKPSPPKNLMPLSSYGLCDAETTSPRACERSATSTERAPDQTEIGLFWIESSPLAWNRLARAISVSASPGANRCSVAEAVTTSKWQDRKGSDST